MCNFDFLEKDLDKASPPHVVHYCSKQNFLSCYVLITDQILLSDCFYFLRYWAICITIVCLPGCGNINVENNSTSLIKLLKN